MEFRNVSAMWFYCIPLLLLVLNAFFINAVVRETDLEWFDKIPLGIITIIAMGFAANTWLVNLYVSEREKCRIQRG